MNLSNIHFTCLSLAGGIGKREKLGKVGKGKGGGDVFTVSPPVV
jgi:hypothetical protein